MVDHLSRVKQLTKKLGLQRNTKSDLGSAEEDRKSFTKLDIEDEKRVSYDLGKVEMRKQLGEKHAGLTVNTDDDDDVFHDGVDGKEMDNSYRYKKATPTPMTAPLVNKRLRKVKRPLEVTKSMPLSPAAIPDKEKILEDKLRADMDFLCAEMVSLRRKDQEIAKSLLKLYIEIQKLKVKRSCLQHQELLEEATYEAAEADEVPDMCDAPHKYMSKILLNRGVTKQNVAWRRFSCS